MWAIIIHLRIFNKLVIMNIMRKKRCTFETENNRMRDAVFKIRDAVFKISDARKQSTLFCTFGGETETEHGYTPSLFQATFHIVNYIRHLSLYLGD